MLSPIPQSPAPILSLSKGQPPSRHDNPFATCWTRPGALAFRFTDNENTHQLIARLAAQNWRGAIVGPHGSGKSTLLEALKPALLAAGKQVFATSLHNRQRRLPRDFFPSEPAGSPRRNKPGRSLEEHPLAVVIIDGYEQLGWLERTRIIRRCRRNNIGLLVTTHARTRIPTLIQLAPNHRLIAQLVTDLSAEVSTPITFADVAASHACHGSNVREIFFDLYDRHERGRRAPRTPSGAATY